MKKKQDTRQNKLKQEVTDLLNKLTKGNKELNWDKVLKGKNIDEYLVKQCPSLKNLGMEKESILSRVKDGVGYGGSELAQRSLEKINISKDKTTPIMTSSIKATLVPDIVIATHLRSKIVNNVDIKTINNFKELKEACSKSNAIDSDSIRPINDTLTLFSKKLGGTEPGELDKTQIIDEKKHNKAANTIIEILKSNPYAMVNQSQGEELINKIAKDENAPLKPVSKKQEKQNVQIYEGFLQSGFAENNLLINNENGKVPMSQKHTQETLQKLDNFQKEQGYKIPNLKLNEINNQQYSPQNNLNKREKTTKTFNPLYNPEKPGQKASRTFKTKDSFQKDTERSDKVPNLKLNEVSNQEHSPQNNLKKRGEVTQKFNPLYNPEKPGQKASRTFKTKGGIPKSILKLAENIGKKLKEQNVEINNQPNDIKKPSPKKKDDDQSRSK